MARYTHDLSRTSEPGGLFFSTATPRHRGDDAPAVPGQVFVAQLTTTLEQPDLLNELSLQFSGNAIESEYATSARNRRDALGLDIPELFPENRGGLIPRSRSPASRRSAPASSSRTPTATPRSPTPCRCRAATTRSRPGCSSRFEQKNELSHERHAGQLRLRGRRRAHGLPELPDRQRGRALRRVRAATASPRRRSPRACAGSATRSFVQDSWKLRPGLVLDYGVRFAVYPGVADERDRPQQLRARALRPRRGPRVVGPGRHHARRRERGLRERDRRRRAELAPRPAHPAPPRPIGCSRAWASPGTRATTAARCCAAASASTTTSPWSGSSSRTPSTNPPFVDEPHRAQLRGSRRPERAAAARRCRRSRCSPSATTSACRARCSRTSASSGGCCRRAVLDVGYLGSRGDHLIQPVDVNAPLPADVVAAGGVLNLARPYQGYAGITMRQTTARSRLPRARGRRCATTRAARGRSARLHAQPGSKTRATNDRDAIDLPQDRTRPRRRVRARAHRPHARLHGQLGVRAAVLRRPTGACEGGPSAAGRSPGSPPSGRGRPSRAWSNGNTNGGRRGTRVDAVGDPFAGVPASGPGYVYWFSTRRRTRPRRTAHSATPAARPSGCQASTSGT